MKLTKCIFVILLLNLFSLTSAANEAQFECGHHGRFEYCIDGVPGCVIGCHCHPGYYFDTDTKICEPNTKLTQDLRRFLPEPTRVQISSLDMTPLASNPTPTTNILDENVEAIAKDADDLGDWLYNQFFKTIENQVINNTQGEQLTRRSGSGPPIPTTKLKRKSGKKSKRNKSNKKTLRKKLLRITEDDSLFDSDSDSSDSSRSDTSSSSSDTENDDKEHGHRKIIVIKKKSTPLPSFIFLPNMDTPFYPPIGLPPPPIPMYPMVPVPPMLPMYPGTMACEDETSAAPSTNEGKSTTTASTTISTRKTTKEAIDNATNEVTNDTPSTDSKRYLRKGNKYNQRNEFLRNLRNKMSKHYERLPDTRFVNTQLIRPDLPFIDDSILEDILYNNELQSSDPEETKLNNVNFKYLSQLIHKTNSNKTKNIFDYPNNRINYPIENQRDIKINGNKFNTALDLRKQPIRKFGYQNNLPKFEEPDNSYYANLGKQIATLIRKIDSKNEHEIDLEIKDTRGKSNSQPIFNENLFAPHSFWERSIRSPLKKLRAYNDNADFFLDNHDKLISLEEQVNWAATTKPTLTLQQLENIVSLMNRQQPRVKRKQLKLKLSETPNGNFNINLLPVKDRRSNTVGPIGQSKKPSKPFDVSKNFPYNFHINSLKDYETFKDSDKHKHHNTPPKIKSKNINKSSYDELPKMGNSHNLGREQKSYKSSKSNIRQKAYVLSSRPQTMKFLNSNIRNPVVIGYKQKYYDGQSQLDNAIHRPFSSNQVDKPQSYFYHDINQFSYFD